MITIVRLTKFHKQIHPWDFTKWEVIPGQILHAAGAPVIEDGHTTVALQTGGAIDVSSMAPTGGMTLEVCSWNLRTFEGRLCEYTCILYILYIYILYVHRYLDVYTYIHI